MSRSYIRVQPTKREDDHGPLGLGPTTLDVQKDSDRSVLVAQGKVEKDGEDRHMDSVMNEKQLRRIGLILVIGGIMLFLDGAGSLLVPQHHDFWFDLERLLRTIGGILLSLLGLYVLRHSGTSPHDVGTRNRPIDNRR